VKSFRRAIFFSGFLGLFVLVGHFLILPQNLLGSAFLSIILARLEGFFIFPGLISLQLLGVNLCRHPSLGLWCGFFLTSVVLYLLMFWTFFYLWSISARKPNASAESAGVSRRDFLRKGSLVVAGAAFSGLQYSMILEPKRVVMTRYVIPIRDLPRSLEGLRIVQLTDIHHGPWFSLDDVHDAVQRTNELKPDLILLTGDYVHKSPDFIPPVISALGQLKARCGVLGVLGNHDWYEGAPQLRDGFKQVNISLIDNDRVFLRSDGVVVNSAPEEGLCIAGVGDHWEDEVDFESAFRGVPSMTPRLVLSHNPDVAQIKKTVDLRPRIDLMLSGHTHGGQL